MDIAFENNNFRITPECLLYIPANTEYTRQSYDDEEIIAIHFNILNKVLREPFVINVDETMCNNCFMEIHNMWNKKEKGYKYKSTAILYEYLSTILMEKRNSKEYTKIKKSIDYIETHLSEKLRIDELAKMCMLCETQYRKLFKAEFGVSPVQYINKLRINTAINIMSSGYYSMAEIAELCGFSEQKYFNKVFYSETGKTPTQYTKELLYIE